MFGTEANLLINENSYQGQIDEFKIQMPVSTANNGAYKPIKKPKPD